jgi:D-glycero-D-manno-heptose 1,7-bisphosphate phosphatase
VFLDRDGVIVENRDAYIRCWDDVAFVPGAVEALVRLAASPFAVVVVTNQSAVGRGLLSLDEALRINRQIVDVLVRAGARVDGAYLCPHHPEDDCACRKPRPGLLEQAAREHDLDLGRSWLVGDALSDLEAGRAVGARAVLVRTGRGRAQAELHGLEAVPDLAAAVDMIFGAAG